MRLAILPFLLASSVAIAGAGRVACPTGANLEQVARTAWKVNSGEVFPECYALTAGEPLWLVVGYLAMPNGASTNVGLASTLVAPTGEVWPVAATPARAMFSSEALHGRGAHPAGNSAGWRSGPVDGEWIARDLDGDGRDELVHITGKQRDGWSASDLTVSTVVDHELVTSEPVRISNSFSGLHGETRACGSTHRFVAGPHHTTLIEITAAAVAIANPDDAAQCPARGRHRYRWTGSELVEVR